MAVTLNAASVARNQPLATFTMSLTQGWDQIPPEHGGRSLAAGDLIVLEVRKPPAVTGPPGWTSLGEFTWTDDEGREHPGHAFWKVIGQPWQEIPPLFTAEGAPEWEIRGHALTGCAPAGDGVAGSAVPAPLP